MLPWYRKPTNCASLLGGDKKTKKNMKEYFDLNIKRANLEDMVASCMSV